MSEKEEMAWSQQRFEDIIATEGPLILPGSDERVQALKRVCDRLIEAMDADDMVCSAIWPRDDVEVTSRIRQHEARGAVRPSARTNSAFLPYRPESSNPQKIIEHRDWDLFVIDLPKINAFVLRSYLYDLMATKEIFVYSGLLDLLEKEEPLIAAVIAHEIIHVSERHSVENMGFLALTSVVFDILRGISFAVTISFPFVTDALGSLFNVMNDVVAERAYSRKLESEADTLGLMLMARAGYNPESALELWGLLNMIEKDAHATADEITAERLLPFLRTHPQGDDRLANIEKHLPAAMKLYKETLEPSKAQQISDALKKHPGGDEGQKV
ncbi:hypothetical protein EMMF5_000046 [Cystobasidiomycetes sp. EMM_F5]